MPRSIYQHFAHWGVIILEIIFNPFQEKELNGWNQLLNHSPEVFIGICDDLHQRDLGAGKCNCCLAGIFFFY